MFSKCLIAISIILFAPIIHALDTDKSSPIFIEADQVDLDEKNGVSTYTGNVTLRQGSIQVQADSIVVYSFEKQLKKIVASGSPATYRQKPNPDSEDLTASAARVEYDTNSGVLVLEERAKLEQGQNEFSGNKIEYDTLNNVMRASKTQDNQERVKAVIQPSLLESKP